MMSSRLFLNILHQLKLKSHNDSFDKLLRVIPAKYYILNHTQDSDNEDSLESTTPRKVSFILVLNFFPTSSADLLGELAR